jgi:hypothetical protein
MSSDILIIPKSGDPQILFRGSGINNTAIQLKVLSNYQSASGSGTALVFEGTQGQLFSITDNLSSGTIFSVGDITGLPLLEIDASGRTFMSRYGSTVDIFNSVQIRPSGNGTGATSALRFYEQAVNGSNFVGFAAPSSIINNVTWTLPSGDGAAGSLLSTNGSTSLSWTTGVNISGGLVSASGFSSTAYIQTSGAFITQNASFVLASGHNGKTILSSGASQINVTVSGNLPIGFGAAFIQTGPGAIFYSGAPGINVRNRQGHTRSNGLWSATSLVQFSGGAFLLAGDTTT